MGGGDAYMCIRWVGTRRVRGCVQVRTEGGGGVFSDPKGAVSLHFTLPKKRNQRAGQKREILIHFPKLSLKAMIGEPLIVGESRWLGKVINDRSLSSLTTRRQTTVLRGSVKTGEPLRPVGHSFSCSSNQCDTPSRIHLSDRRILFSFYIFLVVVSQFTLACTHTHT